MSINHTLIPGSTLSKHQLKEFNQIVMKENMQRIKIIGFFGMGLESFFGILLLIGILPYDYTATITIVSMLILCVVCTLTIHFLQKKQWHMGNVLVVNLSAIALVILSIVVTYFRFLINIPDIWLYLVVLFLLNIIVINKPLKSLAIILGSFLILAVLILTTHSESINYSLLFNGLGFAGIAFISSIITYNNRIRIFVEHSLATAANDKLRIASRTDQLTGLNNRRRIDEVLKRQVRIHNESLAPFCIIMLDIDHFKRVNDKFGHLRGDKALMEIGSVLRHNLRPIDICGRWGGEEFIIICCGTHLDEAVGIANRIQQKISAHDFGDDLSLKISIGISEMQKDVTIEQVINWADTALYKAKDNGRNRIEVMTHSKENVTAAKSR